MMWVKRTRPGEKDPTTSLPVLPEAVSLRSTLRWAPEILFCLGMSGREQTGEPTSMATKARKPARGAPPVVGLGKNR